MTVGQERLKCSAVTVNFGGIVALEDIDVTVPSATVVGLVGPNGAGKSTLFGVLSGLLRPSKGTVVLDGVDITDSRPQQRANWGMARTFQHPELFADLTVREHLVLAHRAKHDQRRIWSDLFTMGSFRSADTVEKTQVDELVAMLGLTAIADRTAVGLPLGVARLIELGRALASSPTVLLLDEPSSGLDSSDTEQFESTLGAIARQRGISVLLVEHDVELVMRMCTWVYVLDFGKMIANGAPDVVRADPGVRAAYLGEEVSGANAATNGSSAGATVHGSARAPLPPQSVAGQPRPSALVLEGLSVRYGDAKALSDVSFDLPQGQVLAVLGPNGAGKSSLARAIAGLVPSGGQIVLAGEEISGWPAHRVRRAGIVHLPEGRGVFRGLTVTENLRMGVATLGSRQARREAVERAFEIFPALDRRRHHIAGLLSGGEQQMLSLARALATMPKLLIADELSLGLAPLMVDVVFEGLARARDAGVTVIMTEQYVYRALSFADQCLVLQRGEIAWKGPADIAKGEVLRHYLGDGMMAAT